jgi:hypothetical protein
MARQSMHSCHSAQASHTYTPPDPPTDPPGPLWRLTRELLTVRQRCDAAIFAHHVGVGHQVAVWQGPGLWPTVHLPVCCSQLLHGLHTGDGARVIIHRAYLLQNNVMTRSNRSLTAAAAVAAASHIIEATQDVGIQSQPNALLQPDSAADASTCTSASTHHPACLTPHLAILMSFTTLSTSHWGCWTQPSPLSAPSTASS